MYIYIDLFPISKDIISFASVLYTSATFAFSLLVFCIRANAASVVLKTL